jgi:GNAT superfamily N-acetyltransferase
MTIRPATLADVPRLVAMGRQQLAATYGDAIADAPAALEALATQLVTTPTCACFVADQAGAVVGMIGLVAYAHPCAGAPTAGEVMWWVDPAARGIGAALLKRAERWACETGASQIQMIAPAGGDPRVGLLYQRRGYRALETTYQRPVTPAMAAITVVDDVLPDVAAYVAATRAQPFGAVEPTPGVVFHGIAAPVSDALPQWIAARWPALTPTTTFVRRSPAGQVEPNFIHTDRDMGEWTAIAYLTPDPPTDDGTTFWRWTRGAAATGAIASLATTGEALLAEWQAWRDPAQWTPWHTVPAQLNRLVLFPSSYFHARALAANYGAGETARLIQVVFGTGGVP